MGYADGLAGEIGKAYVEYEVGHGVVPYAPIKFFTLKSTQNLSQEEVAKRVIAKLRRAVVSGHLNGYSDGYKVGYDVARNESNEFGQDSIVYHLVKTYVPKVLQNSRK